ncbi:MAG: CocE/NonD family hydrolase, partial [Pseudomonadales bacterium]|nr:CocE/NonD family hydrolase [Pseudomonadales bacterium]
MSDAEYEVIVERDIMVPMRDGVRLATDLYRPAVSGEPAQGAFPVVFMRTPYNKVARERQSGYCRYFAERGYVAVTQDCRGCFRSEGDVRFLIPEAEDGFDTLAWIKGQPWAGPGVGSWGTSWSGWTQTAMAALGPDNLAVMIPNMSGANGFTSSVRHNGALELRFIAWAFWHSRLNFQEALKADPAVDEVLNNAPDFSEWLTRWPIKPGHTQLSRVPPYQRWVTEL